MAISFKVNGKFASMLKKGTRLYSILKVKCPKCHEGELFQHSNPYNLKNSLAMHEHCPVCGFRYEIETGFFYGSMYVSYGLSIAFSVAVLVAMYVFSLTGLYAFDFISYLLVDGILLLIFMPVMFRYSRAVWMNMFVSYDPAYRKP